MRSGSGVDALFVHANGFCKELWLPVARRIEELDDEFGWTAIDLRGHGHSDRSEPPYSWARSAEDVTDVSNAIGPFRVGVGHSIGGALVARAEAMARGTFDRLVLIEPIILPPPFERTEIPLARMADTRRSSFVSRDAARHRFANGPFSAWTDDAIECYLDGGFVDTPEGFTLRCPPEVEADYFREGNNHDTWDRVGSIEIPILLMFGSDSDSPSEELAEAMAARFERSDVTVLAIEGAGHLGPMSAPDAIARQIARFAAR